MTALQEHTGAFPAQADSTAGGGHAALLYVEFAHTFPLLLLELLENAPLLLPPPAPHVLPPQDEDERGEGRDAKREGQDSPQSDAVPLLPQERLVVQPGEEVMEALLGRLELDQVVIQDQLSHARHAVS